MTAGHHGVVDGHSRTVAVPNLYITDGSVLPTQGSATPASTIGAVAARRGPAHRRHHELTHQTGSH